MSVENRTVLRREDEALLSGRGRFVDDLRQAGMAHAAFVRSSEAHARIGAISTEAALALDGVLAVLTFHDLPEEVKARQLPVLMPTGPFLEKPMPYALARDEVAFVGEPVAVVVARDRYVAEDAAELVEVDYEPLPVVADVRTALAEDAPLARLGARSNLAARLKVVYGDTEAAFADARHVVGRELFVHRGGGHSIEARGVVASYSPFTQTLSVHCAAQGPHALQRAFSEMLGWSLDRVHVTAPDVGGGFGPKMPFYPEYCAVACASIRLGRPVKWIEDRREHFLACYPERDQLWNVEMALAEDGAIRGLRGTLLHDKGADIHHSIALPYISATTLPGPYLVPALDLDVKIVLTNKVATSPVRGAGRPQAVFAMERLLDAAARRLGMDRVDIRRHNLIPAARMPYAVGINFRDGRPLTYDSGDYPATQEKALDLARYAAFEERKAEAAKAGKYRGIGIANCVEGTGIGPFEGATVRVDPASGKVVVMTGAADQGQGHKTTLAQICGAILDVPVENVEVVIGDTSKISHGVGTFASRVTVNAGSATHIAATKLRTRIVEMAARMLDASVDELEFADGRVGVSGRNVALSFGELADAASGQGGFGLPPGVEPGLETSHYYTPEQATYANGSHVAEVEVDIGTGSVRLLNYTVAHDCGTVINPPIVHGQIVGGVAHGIGSALLEKMVYDDAAQPLTTSLAEYLLPSADIMPRIAVTHTESPSPHNPLGAKGAGEGGTIPAIAAIVSAVEDALSPFGVEISSTPVTPEDVVRMIREARQSSSSGEQEPAGR